MKKNKMKKIKFNEKRKKYENKKNDKPKNKNKEEKKIPTKEKLSSFYKKSYKFFLIIPFLLLIFTFFSISHTLKNDGTVIYRDVTLKGGVSAVVNINSHLSQQEIINHLKKEYPNNTFRISELFSKGKRIGFIIDTDMKNKDLKIALSKIFKTEMIGGKNYNANVVSASLSASFFSQAIKILIVSFTLMSIVVFLYFKEFVPAGAVVLSGLFDMIVTIGVLDYFGVRISISGIGAILMLIGYSIDTDVLLTNRLVREKGNNYFEKVFDAFKTGILMSLTTLFAGLVALFLTNSSIIFQISLVLVIGILVDIISTWIQNTAILLMYFDRKNK